MQSASELSASDSTNISANYGAAVRAAKPG